MAAFHKFKDVTDSVIENLRVLKKLEWSKFSKTAKVDLLQRLADEPLNNLKKNEEFKTFLNEDNDFFEETLEMCIQKGDREFGQFIFFIKKLNLFDKKLESVMLKLVQMSKANLLESILVNLANANSPILKHSKTDSKVLMEACRRDHYDLVKILVKHGFRLKAKYSHKAFQKRKRYTDNPLLMVPCKEHSSFDVDENEEEADEITDLNLLRMMSKRSYIISCYEVAYEDYMFGGQEDCKGHLSEKDEENHHCPGHKKFKTSLNCEVHMECNDPIFRCFDLAKLACGYAYRLPEYREEYQEVANECSAFAVELLDQCKHTKEVKILLQESSGSSKYFRYSRFMKYPRLRLAIEHNHKEFVGHMFCQQALRQAWTGKTSWEGALFFHKLLHMVIQVFCAPIFVLSYLTIGSARSMKIANDKTSASWPRNWLFWFRRKTKDFHLYMDVPLNRFLIFSGYYLIFVSLLIRTILDPSLFHADELEEYQNTFTYKHVFLGLFVASMVLEDISTFLAIKSITTYFKFWRIYDLFMHLTLTVGLSLRGIRVMEFGSDDCIDIGSETTCHALARDHLHDSEAIFMATAATLALNRSMYWLQFHEKIGPIVINMSRVFRDILTLGGTYLIICMSFSFGLVFATSGEVYYKNNALLNSTAPEANLTAYASNFGKTAYLLLWTILDSGPKDEISNDGARGAFATALYMVYQVSSIVILLNLLIAVMNSTVQKFTDRRQLYWKYSKTGAIIEYFDDHAALPIPFSILTFIIGCFKVAFLLFKKLNVKLIKKQQKQSYKNSTSCSLNEDGKKARKEHADVMMNLIKRFKGKNSIEENDDKSLKLEQIKEEIKEEVIYL